MNLNIDNYKYSIIKNNILYIYEKKQAKQIIKRISNINNKKTVDFIKIHNNVSIESISYKEKDKITNTLTDKDKENIINDIFDVLSKSEVKNLINLNELLYIVKSSYINYIISDNVLALSTNKSNKDLLNIILLETNEIIGEIKLNDSLNIIVDEYYIENTLKLLKNYICLFKKEDKYVKILK